MDFGFRVLQIVSLSRINYQIEQVVAIFIPEILPTTIPHGILLKTLCSPPENHARDGFAAGQDRQQVEAVQWVRGRGWHTSCGKDRRGPVERRRDLPCSKARRHDDRHAHEGEKPYTALQ